jgi:6-phosphogluconolactonase
MSVTYELNDPMAEYDLGLPGEVYVAPDVGELYDALAMVFTSLTLEADQERGEVHIALSGGTTPWPFYRNLLIDTRFRSIPWERTHIWMVDERRVPEDDDLNNFKSLRASLLEDIPTPPSQIHPMMAMRDDPAGLYEAEMRMVFGTDVDVPRMDFVLLGMGGDCHTASLFPNSDAIHVNDRWVVVNDGTHVTPPPRVTMTYPLLNAARHLVVLCVGEKKAGALQRVAQQVKTGPDPINVPITGIQPTDGSLTWYLDREAAGGVDL